MKGIRLIKKSFFLLFLIEISLSLEVLPEEDDFSPYTIPIELHETSLTSFSEEVVEARMGKELRQVMNVYIGTPEQKLRLKISTAICGLWVIDKEKNKNGFNPEKSRSLEEMGIEGKVDFTFGRMVKDYIKFVNATTTEPIPFLLVEEMRNNKNIEEATYGGLIGFGYKCRSKSVGNIDLLKILTQPKKKPPIFAFRYNNAKKGGTFYLGGYPGGLNTESKLFRTVPVDKNNNNGHWEVHLYSVYFSDGKFFSVGQPFSIGIGGSMISVNEAIFNHVVYGLLSDEIDSKRCFVEKEDVFEVFCNMDIDAESLESINFVVGKWSLKVPGKDLFKEVEYKGKKYKWLTIVYYPEHPSFYLSQTVLGRSQIMVYDKKNNLIGLYTGSLEKK